MVDKRNEPHGPAQLPDRQPRMDATDVAAQPALQRGASSRWLVPAAVLAAVTIVLSVIALRLQLVLPIVGIVWAVVMWLSMLLVARRGGEPKGRNRKLAWLMGALAVGSLLVFIAIYVVENVIARA
jgi:hypothetical protein